MKTILNLFINQSKKTTSYPLFSKKKPLPFPLKTFPKAI